MKLDAFPDKIKALAKHSCRFEATKLTADNCDVFFASYPAGTDIEPHTHDTENYGVVTKGRMTLVINGHPQTYESGDWYHIPANAEHCAQCDEDTEQIEFWFTS